MEDIESLRRILKENHTIAVVGLSAQWFRPSFFAAKYLQEHGYRVIPVNPAYPEILGEKCYPSLRDVPEKVDVVDIFRKPADVPPIVEDAIAIGAKVAWLQIGVIHEAAALAAVLGDRWRTGNSDSRRSACTPERSPIRRPARARRRSTSRRRTSSTAPTTPQASSTCRRSATSTRGS